MSVDIVGIVVFLLGLLLYYAAGRKGYALIITGIGAGMVIAAVWFYIIIQTFDFAKFFR